MTIGEAAATADAESHGDDAVPPVLSVNTMAGYVICAAEGGVAKFKLFVSPVKPPP